MWPYYPELLAIPVPRYTSFPTAAEFREDVGAADFAEVIEGTTGDVSLYVHIPFCEKICWYCGCNTSAANRTERVSNYLDSLHREIALVGDRLPNAAKISQIAFGGGSPNAIPPLEFVRLMDALTVHFGAAEPTISIEVDPRTFSRDWAAVIEAVGIERVSLGVQTFTPAIQEAIGRVQPFDLIADTTAMLRAAGVSSLNFDLMYGLPGQSLADLEETLERTMALGADRVALFGYAHVPHIVPRQKRIDASALPDLKQRFEMAAAGYDQLVASGYVPVGFDHFARPEDPLAKAAREGALRRNFQGFTEDQAPVLVGLGASAISSFPDLLVQNEKNPGRYRMMLSQDRLTGSRGVRRLPTDRERGAVIEQLLCHGSARLDQNLVEEAATHLAPFVERGLAAIDRDWCTVLPEGLPYARSIAAQFDPYRQDSLRRFSSAV
ncbi:MAG: oxygen-independent coproporphyrinogen III oxidase [Novosphingobium sp.]|nr:oxygen-independent coproporphyrinogen III oxidase [Novosphingobium sp.]